MDNNQENTQSLSDRRWGVIWDECRKIASEDELISEYDLLNSMQQYGLTDPQKAYDKIKNTGSEVNSWDQLNKNMKESLAKKTSQDSTEPSGEVGDKPKDFDELAMRMKEFINRDK